MNKIEPEAKQLVGKEELNLWKRGFTLLRLKYGMEEWLQWELVLF